MAHRIYKIVTASGTYWRSTRCEAEYRCKRATKSGDRSATWEPVDVPEGKFALVHFLNGLTGVDEE